MARRPIGFYVFAILMVMMAVAMIISSLAVIMEGGSRTLGIIDIKALLEDERKGPLPPPVRVGIKDGGEGLIIVVCFGEEVSILCAIDIEQSEIWWSKEFNGEVSFSAVEDLDGDEIPEIAILENPACLQVYTQTGEEIGRFSYVENDLSFPQIEINPVFTDFNNDGHQEIVVAGKEELFIHNPLDLSLINNIDLNPKLEIGDRIISLAGGDINKDGCGEIIIGTWLGNLIIISQDGKMLIKSTNIGYEEDEEISAFPNILIDKGILLWSIKNNIIGYTINGRPLFDAIAVDGIISGLAAGDLNNDRVPEIAVSTLNGMGYVFNINGEYLPGWPRNVCNPEPIYSKPIMGSVIFLSEGGSVVSYGIDGGELWREEISGNVCSSAILKDIDGDSKKELLVPSAEGIYILDVSEDEADGWESTEDEEWEYGEGEEGESDEDEEWEYGEDEEGESGDDGWDSYGYWDEEYADEYDEDVTVSEVRFFYEGEEMTLEEILAKPMFGEKEQTEEEEEGIEEEIKEEADL